MTLTTQIKLLPTPEQARLIRATATEYISVVNDLVDYALGQGQFPRMTSASYRAKLSGQLRGAAIRTAQSVYKRCRKTHRQHILRRPYADWNNQSYKVTEDAIHFPVWQDGQCVRLHVKALIPPDALAVLQSHKLGTIRISEKNHKFIAKIPYQAEGAQPHGAEVMGVDLGIKCPAVAVTSTGKVKFFGNGRQNKYVRRRYAAQRKSLGKAKKLNAIRRRDDKEQRWMKDQDHKISRALVNWAAENGVGVIKLENLSGIREATRTSRKNNRSLHAWSFYRLTHFIEYKARMAGITVVYVDPAYTSQTCPVCGHKHHADDRKYVCPSCGYTAHRDLVGARNILAA